MYFTQKTQKYLEGTGSYIGTCLQFYQEQCNWVQSILLNVWMETTLPNDLIIGRNAADLKGSSITYVESLKKRMAWAYKTSHDDIKKEQERNK